MQRIKTATSWRHWPVIEQCIVLKRKLAFAEINRMTVVIFCLVLAVIYAAIVYLDVKRVSDFLGIALLYFATLMLALQPEQARTEDEEIYKEKQKRHVRIALGFVVFGTLMQFASFNLDKNHSQEDAKVKDAQLNAIQKQFENVEVRLKELESRSTVMVRDLDHVKSVLEASKGDLASSVRPHR